MIAILLALACGSERVDVKTLRDVPEIASRKAILGTIEQLYSVPPIQWSNHAPRQPAETWVVGVAAWIVGYKLEADSDWHVVIRDSAGRTMIVELPDPACATSPGVRAAFTKARAQFLAIVGAAPGLKFKTLPQPIPVAVAGVVFLDKPHGQTGVAPNAVELHPVTWLSRRGP